MVDRADQEGEDAALVRGFSEEAHAFDAAKCVGGVAQELLLVGRDVVESDAVDILQGLGQGGAADIIRRAGFELEGQLIEDGLLERDGGNHLAPALVRGEAVQPFFFAVEDADAGGAVDLMSGEDVELGVQRLDVYFYMGDGLGAIQQDGHAVFVGYADEFVDGVDRAEHVGDVGDGHESGAFAEQVLVFVQAEFAFLGDGNHPEGDAFAGGLELPGHDVGVVLHGGDNDLVAGLHAGVAKGGCDEVDRFGRAAGEDDLVRGAGVQEGLYRPARFFVRFGGPLTQVMDAPVYVGVQGVIPLFDSLDHAAGLLGGGAVVQVDERLAVYLFLQDREIVPDRIYIKHRIFFLI